MDDDKKQAFLNAIKPLLIEWLIENPPNRFQGYSDWYSKLCTRLAEEKVISGGTSPCCEEWCDKDKPCGYHCNLSTEEIEKELTNLINNL